MPCLSLPFRKWPCLVAGHDWGTLFGLGSAWLALPTLRHPATRRGATAGQAWAGPGWARLALPSLRCPAVWLGFAGPGWAGWAWLALRPCGWVRLGPAGRDLPRLGSPCHVAGLGWARLGLGGWVGWEGGLGGCSPYYPNRLGN